MTAAASNSRAKGGGLFRLIDYSLRPIEAGAAAVGGLMMLLAMVLMTLDAVMRYLFTSPIEIAPRLIEFYLMVGMFSLPLAWGFRTGGYIRIVAAVVSLPARARNFILRAGLLASGVYVAALAWTSAIHFLETWQTKEVYVGVIDWSIAWSWIWVPVGLGLLAARLFLMTFGSAEELNLTHSEGS